MEYFDTDHITAQSVAVEDYYSRFTGEEIDARLAEVMPHVQNSVIHITSAERTAWNGKQPAITDLAAIRSGAALGATALQPNALAGYATQWWVQQQGYLTQHQSLVGYATESWVQQQGYLTQHQSLTGYATESWVKQQGYLTQHQSLVGYAKETWVEGKGYATESWANNKFAAKATTLSGYGINDAVQFNASTDGKYVAARFRNTDLIPLAVNNYIEFYGNNGEGVRGYFNMEMGSVKLHGSMSIGDATISYDTNSKTLNIPGYAKAATTLPGYGITDAVRFLVSNDKTYVMARLLTEELYKTAASGHIEWWGSSGFFNMEFGSAKLNGTLRIGNAYLEYDSTYNALRLYRLNADGIQQECHFISSGDVASFNALGAFSTLKSLTLSEGLSIGKTVIKSESTSDGKDNLTVTPTGKVNINGALLATSLECQELKPHNSVLAATLTSLALGDTSYKLQRLSLLSNGTASGATQYLYVTISGNKYRINMEKLT